MKSILVIAYYFPPEGNAGTYRPLRFVRGLSKNGWSPSVISLNPYQYERYDPELLTLIPQGLEIIRVSGRDLWQAFQSWRGKGSKSVSSEKAVQNVKNNLTIQSTGIRAHAREIVRRLEDYYYLPDYGRPWIRPAVRASLKCCKLKKINVIWATVGPISSGVVAYQVSRESGVPYVLDFRDPWGLNYYPNENRRPRIINDIVRRRMFKIFRNAQSVVFLFESVAECYQRAYPRALDDKKIHIIPNGYEGAIEEFHANSGEKCKILYTGTVTTYRYDTLLSALAVVRKSYPDYAKQLCIQFIGEGVKQLIENVKSFGLSEMVQVMPPTSHKEVRLLQQAAHAFLILGRTSERKGHELVAGAKLFEYLKARRPIIGVLPKDETRKVLEHVRVSTLADVESRSEIISIFLQIVDAWRNGILSTLLPDRIACEQYSIEKQTGALIRALRGDMAETPFQSGVVEVPMSLAADIGS